MLIAVGCGGCLQEMGTSINPYMACWGKNTPALLNNASDAHTATQQRHLIVQVKQYISTQVQQGAEGKPKPRALASNKLQSQLMPKELAIVMLRALTVVPHCQ